MGGNIMAASVIVTVPLILPVLCFQRMIVSGLAAGAVKDEPAARRRSGPVARRGDLQDLPAQLRRQFRRRDLAGIAPRLDHVAGLGADAVRISAFFRSPMADFGYDVPDCRDVDPMFGTVAAFDAPVARAHAPGSRAIIDMVLSHGSDRHPRFRESCESRTGSRADWHVWPDRGVDGFGFDTADM